MEDDPRRPYKAVIAAVVAGATALFAYADVLPTWVIICAAVIVAGLGTFLVPNPKK